MTKKLNFLLVLLFTFILCACSGKKDNKFYVPGLIDESKNISTLRVVDVPKDPIEIGYFSSANIKLEATYTDGTKGYKTITEELFSEKDLESMKIPGKKSFDFVYRGNHVVLNFELKQSRSTPRFQVIFKDRNGKLLQADMINYLDEAKFYPTSQSLDYKEKGKYYRFDGEWSESIKHIYKNTEVTPKYTECKIVNSFDEYYDRTTYYGMHYDVVSKGTKDNELLLYIGRLYNVSVYDFGELARDDYKNTSIEYQKNNYTRLEFTREIGYNLQNNILINNYYHDSADNGFIRAKLMNSSILNFDLSKEETMDELTLPKCFLRAPSDMGFTGYSKERYDGTFSGTKSIFNHLEVDPYNMYNANGSNILKLSEDYPLGYYDYYLNCDLDVYLAVTYDEELVGDQYQYTLTDAKISFCYNKDDLNFDYVYEKTEFTNSEHVDKLVINDRMIAHAIYVYTQL